MVKTKTTTRKPRLITNPFRKINDHGVHLLDVDKIQQMCRMKGKDVRTRIRERVPFEVNQFSVRMQTSASDARQL